ncbi:hypothetical protein [Streptococcus pneumoniae]|nr:hypothetical protein [Streptococcus pneumoniae]
MGNVYENPELLEVNE